MKTITVHINKGGTGKSTVAFNLAKWLTDERQKKVLLVDGDHSQNLSFSFNEIHDSSIYDLFKGNEVHISKITESLDFIKGSELLEDNTLDLKSKQNNCMIFFMWIADNYQQLKKYDYIIIDTHNDNSLITRNFLAAADVVLGISEPSRNGYRAWLELNQVTDSLKKEIIDPITRKSYVSCEPYLIANKVEHIGNSSKLFIETAETEERYIGMIQKKELMAKSLLENKSIFEMRKQMTNNEYSKHHKFYENIEDVFTKVTNI